MLERLTPLFRLACIVLAVLLLFQVARLVSRRNAFAQISVGSAGYTAPKNDSGTNKPAPPVPPAITARVEKIKESQILGQVMRPPPMALIGIAGPDVLLRGPNGQTGMIRVGEELGGVKLVQVGVNRIVVEHEGQQKELMLFEGFGSDSLLGKEKSK